MSAAARLLLTLVMCMATQGRAHEVRPAHLSVTEVEPEHYEVVWKTPARGNMRLKLDVFMPENCGDTEQRQVARSAAAAIEKWRVDCPGGLAGQSIRIAGLERSLTNTIVTLVPSGGGVQTFHLSGANPVLSVPPGAAAAGIAGTFWQVGVRHIALGIDHILFVFTLVLLLERPRSILLAITAFTVAHSLTLAGAALLDWHLPREPVEAAIALSIVFVASEIVRGGARREGLMQKAPWTAAFIFGLLHGFGFAGAVAELGLPEGAALQALLFFNLGVETGQLLFLAMMLSLIALLREGYHLPAWLRKAPVWAVGVTASYWFLERSAAIFEPALSRSGQLAISWS